MTKELKNIIEDKGDSQITAFHPIFEQKFKKLIKDIKRFKKDPTKKDHLKRLIQEAKDLRKILRTQQDNIITLNIPAFLSITTLSDIQISNNVSIVGFECTEYNTIINIKIK